MLLEDRLVLFVGAVTLLVGGVLLLAVGFGENTGAVLNAVAPAAFIAVPVGPRELALPVLEVVLELADVHAPVLPRVGALALLDVFLELALVDALLGLIHALALDVVVREPPLVRAAVGPVVFALPVLETSIIFNKFRIRPLRRVL